MDASKRNRRLGLSESRPIYVQSWNGGTVHWNSGGCPRADPWISEINPEHESSGLIRSWLKTSQKMWKGWFYEVSCRFHFGASGEISRYWFWARDDQRTWHLGSAFGQHVMGCDHRANTCRRRRWPVCPLSYPASRASGTEGPVHDARRKAVR